MVVSSTLVMVANTFLLIAIAILLVPIATLLLECLLALLPISKQQNSRIHPQPKMAILMPAHNEATVIRPVLEELLPQLNSHDRLVVIADNCTDNTASLARSTGATVIERHDTERRGKGYALDYGVQFLATDPPDVVIIIDADCQVQPGTLEKLVQQAMATGRPAQAIYLMERPAQPKPKDAVSALAFLVKNLVRPTGLSVLNLPCPLTGTGMAFPWSVIRQAKLASGNIVEDMQLGIDLAIAGHPTALCRDTNVLGLLPQQEQAATSQRTRWEHGHLQTILTQAPRLFKAAIQQGRLDLLAIALDVSVPPLSLLVMLWLGVFALAGLTGISGISWLPLMAAAIEGSLLVVAILLAWLKFGRSVLPAKTLLAVPVYLLWKIPLYFAFLLRPQTKWVRTERDS